MRRETPQQFFLPGRGRRLDAVVQRLTELAREVVVDLAGIAAHPRGDLRRQQRRNDAILVRRPDGAVQTRKRGARALLPAKAQRTIEQAIDEPLEAHGDLKKRPAQFGGHPVNHLAAHHRLADRRFLAPCRPVLEEVEDGGGQVVVGRQQSGASRDDAVPVVVRVAGEGKDLEAIPFRPIRLFMA